MPKFSFTQETMPTTEEFQHMLAEAIAESNPVDELLTLAKELQEYERQHEMTSQEFFERYQRGELGDDVEFIEWAGTYRIFQRLKHRVETALMRVAVSAQAETVAA
jgi:hypothetical protein